MSILSIPLPMMADRKARSRSIGFIALGVVIITNSFSIPFAKVLSVHISPISFLFITEALSLTFVILSFGFVPLLRALLKIKHEKVWPLIVLAISNSVFAPLLTFFGLRMTQAMNGELFLRSDTLFLFILSIIVLREKTDRTHILAAFCITLGMITIALKGFSFGMTLNPGDLLVCSGAFLYAFGLIVYKKYLKKVHSDVIIFFRGLVSISTILVVSQFFDHTLMHEFHTLPATIISVLIAFAFFSRFLSMFSFLEAIDRVPVQTIALILPLTSVGSIIVASRYLGEVFQWYHMVGMMLIITGTIVMKLSHQHFQSKDFKKHIRQHHRPHV